MKTKANANAKFSPVHAELRQFTLDFFAFFEAEIEENLDQHKGTFHVRLSPDLAEHFGKNELLLTFHNADNLSEYDLVAHGSRTFDRMLAYLDQRAALTLQNLPIRFTSSEELLQAVRPLNTSIAGLRMQEQTQRIFVFNWRITYRADDKREELYAVVLDENGERLPLAEEPNAPEHALDLEQLFAEAAQAPVEHDERGLVLPAKLPPMTHLVRLAENARKYAIYHADLRCVAHEADILPRLYQSLNRLTKYYSQQIEEVYDAHDLTGEKRRALEVDLERKTAEEVENHRLRVQITLFSYAVIQTPVAVADITLADGKTEATIQVTRNRYNGALVRPSCYACGVETREIALDRNGHVICDQCIRQCSSCMDILCDECGVASCPVCGRENCQACSSMCWACGEHACNDHIDTCPICGDAVCHNCLAACAECGARQCRSHLRADSVATVNGKAQLVCAACAVRCPGCEQFSASLAVCSASGQRFCTACLTHCSRCGEVFGPGFYEMHATDQKPYCVRCLEECPVCHTLTPEVAACYKCGVSYCFQCGSVCDVCDQHCCDTHAHTYQSCSHVVCSDHSATCGVGGEFLCPLCHETCAICERHFCEDHADECQRCGCTYCQECVRATGLCDTCSTIGRDGQPVRLQDEPCGRDLAVESMAKGYHWLRAGNKRYIIYLGKNALMSDAIVVVERTKQGHRVVATRRLGVFDKLRGRLGRYGRA